MRLLESYSKKPVLSLATCLAFLLIGVLCFHKLAVRQYPFIAQNEINVITKYPGTDPKAMNSFVSKPIEAIIAGSKGIDYISAVNVQGQSTVTVHLEPNYPIDDAIAVVSAKVNSVLWKLPQNIFTPIIEKKEDSNPIVYYAFTSNSLSPVELTNYVNLNVLPEIQAIPGVDTTTLSGDQPLAMRIQLNPQKMASYKISAGEVKAALLSQNVQAAAGELRSSDVTLPLYVNSMFSATKGFQDLIVKKDNNQLIRIKDIGTATFGPETENAIAYANGKPAVIVGIIPDISSNYIKVANDFEKLIPTIKAKLPSTIQSHMIWNSTVNDKGDFSLIQYHSIAIAILGIILICLFIGTLRALLSPLITIPFVVFSSFGLLYWAGCSINLISLLGIMLGLFFIFDDLLIVIMNTQAYLDKDHPHHLIKKTSPSSAKDVFVLAFISLFVLLPFVAVTGIAGSLYHQMALSLIFVVLFSGLFSLILSPMLCNHSLAPMKNASFHSSVTNLFQRISECYMQWLKSLIKVRYLVLVVAACLIVFSYLLYSSTHSEIIPNEQHGVIIALGQTDPGSSLNATAKTAQQISKIFSGAKEVKSQAVMVGWPKDVHQLTALAILRPHQSGDRSETEILNTFKEKFNAISSLKSTVMDQPSLFSSLGFNQPVNFVLETTGTPSGLYDIMQQVMSQAKSFPGLNSISTNFSWQKPAINFDINRDKAALLGVPVSSITDSLNIFLAQSIVNWFTIDGANYPVIADLSKNFHTNPNTLNQLFVYSLTGAPVQLSNLVYKTNVTGPENYNEFQQFLSASITANVTPGYTLSQGLDYLKKIAVQDNTFQMSYDFAGYSRYFLQTQGDMIFPFIFSLLGIYLILAARFNNFLTPFAIIISAPLTLVGTIIAMRFMGAFWNIYTEVASVAIIALTARHGILFVDKANELQNMHEGDSFEHSIILAGQQQFRHLFSTTILLIICALPLIFASSHHIALLHVGGIIIGGMILGLFINTSIVPIFYNFLADEIIPSKRKNHPAID